MHETIEHQADWQWNVHAWSKQDNPASAVRHYLAWTAVGRPPPGDTWFAWLCYGQRRHQDALDAYNECRRRYGNERLLLSILTSCSGRPPDLHEASTHLEWQAHHDPLSLVTATRAWQRATSSPAASVEAFFIMLSGQAHNAGAAQTYRACLAAQPDQLFGTAQSYVAMLAADQLVHPYLLGESASAQSLRDQVPDHHTAPADGRVA